MPELPEVEVMRRLIEPFVIDRRIEQVAVLHPRIVRRHTSVDAFVDGVKGTRIEAALRRAKYLYCPLSTGRSLVMHFGLSGYLQLAAPRGRHPPPAPLQPPRGTRAVFTLVGQAKDTNSSETGRTGHTESAELGPHPGVELRFVDARTLGQVFVPPTEGSDSLSELFERLGPEPLDDTFTPELLHIGLQSSTAKIKARLLDQEVVAGLGNIYTDEALFAAGIRPDRPADRLNSDEVGRLWSAIRTTLQEAIRRESLWILGELRPGEESGRERRDRRGDGWPFSPLDDENAVGNTTRAVTAEHGDSGGEDAVGRATPHPAPAVYRRTGQPCRICGTPVERRRISGRSAHFCSKCQN